MERGVTEGGLPLVMERGVSRRDLHESCWYWIEKIALLLYSREIETFT